jgi:hypothetical protein
MSQETNHEEIPKLSKEVVDLIKDFPNYYDDHDKVWVFGEPICVGSLSINSDLTESQKALIEEKITNEELRKRYKDYGLCSECQQPNTWVHDGKYYWSSHGRFTKERLNQKFSSLSR